MLRRVLKSIAPYLKNVADMILERTGMVCSIILAGPIPEEGGRLAVRRYDLTCLSLPSVLTFISMHAGLSKGAEPRDWPATDPVGWEEVENSIVKFARLVYCTYTTTLRDYIRLIWLAAPADMLSRALSPMDDNMQREDNSLSAARTNTEKSPATPSGEVAEARTSTILPAKAGPSTSGAVQTSLAPPRSPKLRAGNSGHLEPQANKRQRPKPRPVLVPSPSPELNAHTNPLTLPLEPAPMLFSAKAAPSNLIANINSGLQSLSPPLSFAPDSTGPQDLVQSMIAPANADTDLANGTDLANAPDPANDRDIQSPSSSPTATIANTGPRGLPWPSSTVTADDPGPRGSPWTSLSTSASAGPIPPVLEWKSIPADFCTQRDFENVHPPPSAPSSTLQPNALSANALSAPSASTLPDSVDIADFPIGCRDAFNIVVNRYRWISHHPRWGICVQGMLQLEISSGFPVRSSTQ